MAFQGLLCRSSNLINNCRFMLNNRLPLLNQVSGIRQKVADTLKDLKIPEKPKRPLTPYFRFIQDRRQSLVEKYPHWKTTQITVQCASEWKTIDPSIKQKYESEYKAEMETFARRYSDYETGLSEEQKQALKDYKDELKKSKIRREKRKKLRDLEKPKRPIGAYMLYVMEQAKRSPNKSYPELLSELKQLWVDLPPGEKVKYTQAATRAKEQYDEDLKKWEMQMIREGNDDVVRQTTLTGKTPKSTKHE